MSQCSPFSMPLIILLPEPFCRVNQRNCNLIIMRIWLSMRQLLIRRFSARHWMAWTQLWEQSPFLIRGEDHSEGTQAESDESFHDNFLWPRKLEGGINWIWRKLKFSHLCMISNGRQRKWHSSQLSLTKSLLPPSISPCPWKLLMTYDEDWTRGHLACLP